MTWRLTTGLQELVDRIGISPNDRKGLSFRYSISKKLVQNVNVIKIGYLG